MSSHRRPSAVIPAERSESRDPVAPVVPIWHGGRPAERAVVTGSPGRAGRRQPAGHDAPAAGRVCPADYRYDPAVLDRPADISARVLYVVGGLYGNAEALDAVEQLASAERARVTLVFNGDFHWFDAESLWFAALDRRVARHAAIRGNVETEIARPAEVGAGCGCAPLRGRISW